MREENKKVKESSRFQYCVAFVLLNEEKMHDIDLKHLKEAYPNDPLALMKKSAEEYGPASDFIMNWNSEQMEKLLDELPMENA